MKQSQIAIIIGAVIVVVGGYILIKTSNSTQPSPAAETTTPKTTTVAPTQATAPEVQKDTQEGETGAEKNGTTETKDAATGQDADTTAPASSATVDEKQTDKTTRTNSPVVMYTVTYGANGYTPATLHVKKGAPVTFKNESDQQMWTASAIHPTHTVYPGSDIRKCGTPDATTIFDMCKANAKGQQWSFTFNEVGTWKYHNHMHPADGGTIIVE